MAYSSITKPTDYFNTITWVGAGNSSRDFTGVGFAPDWVWVKNRGGSLAIAHSLYDRVRGAGSNKELVSNTTTAEGGENHESYDYLSAFGSDGFSSTYAGNVAYYFNESGSNYVGWNWLAANGTASNSDGSITSTVSANTTAGFSIVSYTGNGSAGSTVGHGLGATPAWIIVKNRDQTDKWTVFHQSLPNGANSYLELDQTGAASNLSLSPPYWGTPSSTTFGGLHYDSTNASGEKYIAYCFAEIKGYSKFGSYAGNGDANGTFVYTGFKPAWLMIKSSTEAGRNWIIYDNKRETFNEQEYFMRAQSNGAETRDDGYSEIDLLSNGFKLRGVSGDSNNSNTFVFMAFAENPFVANDSGTAVPLVAR